MKALVVGDANSIFVKQYIEDVLMKINAEVVLVWESFLCDNYQRDYFANSIKLEPFDRSFWINKIPLIRSFVGTYYWSKKIKKKYGNFDVIHIHGLNRFRGNLVYYLRHCTGRIFISVWGDELLRSSKHAIKSYQKYYRIADRITLATKNLRRAFSEKYGNSYNSKIHTNRFGISTFDRIEQVLATETIDNLRRHFGINDTERVIVLIGHNGRTAQRHIELTNMISTMPKNIQDKMIALYTLSYGKRSSDYNRLLEEAINKLHCKHIILDKYLPEDEVARLRCISDILLHAQLTDGFSASVQECLYRGSIVFNGAWLKYDELASNGIYLNEYYTFDELKEKLEDALLHFNVIQAAQPDYRPILRKLSSSELTAKAWLELFECPPEQIARET